jgi:preprotein translocase subunit SecB
MQMSEFQFSNPYLVGLDFKLNSDFEEKNTSPINTEVTFNVAINKDETKPEAVVELTVIIGSVNNDNPFCIEATEGAKFRWNKDMRLDPDKLLQQNAPALLLAYLRPIIAMLTTASPFNTYNLPYIDFTKE